MTQDVCAVGASAGVQTFGLGISGGKHFTDKNCELSFSPSKTSMNNIFNFLKQNNIKILDLQTKDVNLEDVFLMFTKH